MVNRKVLFLTLVIYMAFSGLVSYGSNITINPTEDTPKKDGGFLVAPGVSAIFEIEIAPTVDEPLGTWKSLTLTADGGAWLSEDTPIKIEVLDNSETLGTGNFTEQDQEITIPTDQPIDNTSNYLLKVTPAEDIDAADEEITLTFDKFEFDEDVTNGSSFDLIIKQTIVTDLKFDPVPPVERIPIDHSGVLNEIAKISIEFNQEPGGVWEKLKLELKDVDWLADETTDVQMRVYRDLGEVGFDEREDAWVGQGRFDPDTLSTEIPLYQSVAKVGVPYFLVLSLDRVASVGQEMTLFIPRDGLSFTNVDTGPDNGEFKLFVAGKQKIRAQALTNPDPVPYGEERAIASIDIITDSKVKYWTSLVLGKPKKINSSEPIGPDAVSSISIYRDKDELGKFEENSDELIKQVNGFKDDEDQAVDTIEIKFDNPEQLNPTQSEISSLDFDDEKLTSDDINHFLLVMTAGSESEVEENDRLDAVIVGEAFTIENQYLTITTDEKVSPENDYPGTSGPPIDKFPESYVDLSNCESATVDEEFEINYVATDVGENYVEFFYTNKTQDELQTPDTEDILVGYIGNSLLVGNTKEDSYIWDTTMVKEGKYYIYARIVSTPTTSEATKNDITDENATSAFSSCIVTVIHPLSIQELTPEEDVVAQDGFYLIKWRDKKNGENAQINLYYSESDLDENDLLKEDDVEDDWSYKENLEIKDYKDVVKKIEDSAEPIINSTQQEDDYGDRGQYRWDLTEGEMPVEEGEYYIYAIISDGKYKAAARSEMKLQVTDSTYKPMIKLISPVSGSQASQSYTISWIYRDVKGNAKVSLYYSQEKLQEPIDENDEQSLNVIATPDDFKDDDKGIKWNIDNNRGFYTWQLDEIQSGSYYVYVNISNDNDNTSYSISPSTLLVIKEVKLRLNPNMIAVGKDETCEVTLEVKSPESISSVDIYLNYEPDYLELVNEKQPFSISENVKEIFTEPIRNSQPEDGRLDYSVSVDLLNSKTGLQPTGEFQALAKVTFKVKKVDDCIVNSIISFAFDEGSNRKTLILIDKDDEKQKIAPECSNPALTIQIVPMATISGKVSLESCTECTQETELTFGLRRHDIPQDQDVNVGVETLEITTTSKPDGSYMLENIPAGIWEIVVKAPSYLRSQYRKDGSILLGIAPGENLRNVDIPGDSEKLIGGDVNDDNRINMIDLSLLSKSFGLSKDDEGFISNADINNDGRVIYTDFVILATNFGDMGVPNIIIPSETEETPPATEAAPDKLLIAQSAEQSGTLALQFSHIELPTTVPVGEIVEIPIKVSDAVALKGLAFEAEYDPEIFKLIGSSASQGDFLRSDTRLKNSPVLFISKEIDKEDELNSDRCRIVTVGIIAGKGEGVSGDGVLAKLQFQSIAEGESSIYVNNFQIADSSNQFIPIDYKAVYNLTAFNLPSDTKLLQNYPNPFNPETWLPFTLNAKSNVEIYIYSQNGQLIKRLELGDLRAGNYIHKESAAYWDGSNNVGERVASGVYFYQLSVETEAGSVISPMKKMVILK